MESSLKAESTLYRSYFRTTIRIWWWDSIRFKDYCKPRPEILHFSNCDEKRVNISRSTDGIFTGMEARRARFFGWYLGVC